MYYEIPRHKPLVNLPSNYQQRVLVLLSYITALLLAATAFPLLKHGLIFLLEKLYAILILHEY